jgi:hypothetical protein
MHDFPLRNVAKLPCLIVSLQRSVSGCIFVVAIRLCSGSRLPWADATEYCAGANGQQAIAGLQRCMPTELPVVTWLPWCMATQQWRMPTGSGSLHCSNGALQLNNGALQYVFVIHINDLWDQLAGIDP